MDFEITRRTRNEWKLFEKKVKFDAELQRIFCIKIPEKVKNLFKSQDGPRLVKSDPDFVMGVDGKFVLFDAKVTTDRLWNLKRYCFHQNKIHQFNALLTASMYGNLSGFLIWFKEHRMITWVPITVVQDCQRNMIPSITPETEGVISQPEDEILRFRELFQIGESGE